MTPALQDALEAVYDEFHAPTPTRIDGCPCCVERKTVGGLHNRSLRELTEDDLRAYAFSVFLTIGDVADFRYFLPRIFELAIARPGFATSLEVVLGKLALAGWTSWSQREQESVRRLVDAWFDAVADACVADWDGFDNTLDEMLCGIGRAGLDPVLYLERLLPEERSFALNVLWEINRDAIERKDRLANAFWREAPDAHAAVLARLREPDIKAIVA